MKKWIIALVLLLVLVGGGFSFLWWGPPKLRLVLLGDITAAFAADLRDFVLQHSGRLPTDWKEFEKWETERDGDTRWPADVSDRMMELLSPPENVLGDYPRYVRVIDPDIKVMERYINSSIYSAHIQLGMTNGVANNNP
jgi:hypothetical protein